MTALDTLAERLAASINRRAIPADVGLPPIPGRAVVNVWAPAAAVTEDDPNLNRYPQASVILADDEHFSDFSWGRNFEHTLPIDTDVAVVAARVIESLHEKIRSLAQ